MTYEKIGGAPPSLKYKKFYNLARQVVNAEFTRIDLFMITLLQRPLCGCSSLSLYRGAPGYLECSRF